VSRFSQNEPNAAQELSRARRAWFKRVVAAGAGLPDAQVALGEMMINGRGGSVYPAAARELFEKAAAQHHAGAMFALGAMYSGGHNYPGRSRRSATLVPRHR
jgi:TPR repeat protein